MRVVRDDVGLAGHHGKKDALRGAALVGRNHMLEPGEILHHALEAVETFTAGIGFIAAHHGRPLLGGHGAGAGVGQEIDQDILGVDEEQVVAGLLEETPALFGRGLPERFDTLDAEWLDDGFHYASTSIRASAALPLCHFTNPTPAKMTSMAAASRAPNGSR